MNLSRYGCEYCGEEFEAACLSELKRKKAAHKCRLPNKRVMRTVELQQEQADQFVRDVAVDRIQQYNFEKLLRTGMIVDGS